MKPCTRRSNGYVLVPVVLVARASALLFGVTQAAFGDGLNYVPNEYIIHVRPGTSVSTVEQAVNAIGASLVKTIPVPDTYLIRLGLAGGGGGHGTLHVGSQPGHRNKDGKGRTE